MDTRDGLWLRGPASIAALAMLLGCGAKTGLEIPDASRGPDAGMDAGPDAGPDAGMCMPRPLALDRRGAQVMFVIDRSNSMDNTLDGRDPLPGDVRRWDLLSQVLDDVLNDADRLLEIGAKFYPRWFSTAPAPDPEAACSVSSGIDLPPARGNTRALLDLFTSTQPQGGTPTAVALTDVRDFFARRPSFAVPRFVILATDGGPNCNPDTGVPHTACLCTGTLDYCRDEEFGPYNCIDRERTLEAIRSLASLDAPVYVVGMDDPTRPDLADVLDAMAVAGERPRDEPGERRFYSVRRPDDLRGALTTITDSISRCVFTLTPVPGPSDELDVLIDGVLVPRDRLRSEGWDYSSSDGSELTLFGGACERVTRSGAEVIAEIACPPEI